MTTSRVLGDIRDCSVDIFMSYCLGLSCTTSQHYIYGTLEMVHIECLIQLWLISLVIIPTHLTSTMLVPCSKGVDKCAITHR